MSELIRIIKTINIQGIETDKNANKKFLCMKYNREKKNYRSPYTNTFWPDNQRSYVTPKISQLENILNTFLEHYVSMYYAGGVSSGFVAENKLNQLTFYIGISKENAERNTFIASEYSYKVFSKIEFSLSEVNNSLTFKIDVQSELLYSLKFDIIALNESVTTHGILKNNTTKQYNTINIRPSNEEIIELVGNNFERSENSLRNKELVNIIKTFKNQFEDMVKQENSYKENFKDFFGKLKNLESKVPKSDVKRFLFK